MQSWTIGDSIVQEAFGETYEGIKDYNDLSSAVDDLRLGHLDAVVADSAQLLNYVKKVNYADYKFIKDPSFEVEYYGLMVKKGNKELLDKLNMGLEKIMDNGIYDYIYQQYFAEKVYIEDNITTSEAYADNIGKGVEQFLKLNAITEPPSLDPGNAYRHYFL